MNCPRRRTSSPPRHLSFRVAGGGTGRRGWPSARARRSPRRRRSATADIKRRQRPREPMSSPTDQLPALPVERWWGEHLRETRRHPELYRLLVGPVFHGRGVPRGDGRPVILLPGFGGGGQTPPVLPGRVAPRRLS